MLNTPADLDRLQYLHDLQRRAGQRPDVALADFVSKCLIVEKETGALIPFSLWPLQREALKVIEREDKLIVPKGRQIGMTHLELAAMLWAGTQRGHRLFPIARQSQEYAQDAITRLILLAGYDPNSNPPDMRVLSESPMPATWRPEIVAKTTMSLTFANGSHYRALTATQQIGRGLAAYWGLADEMAFWPWPSQQIAALESGCARLHIVSTGNGEGGYFYDLYQKAVDGEGEYTPLFVPSTADPRRDHSWYVRNVDQSADPEGAAREHARRVEDAFRAPKGAYFKRFDRARNVADVAIAPGWPTYRSIDHGFRHPACLWEQVAPSGQVFVVDELLPENMTTTEFVQAVVAREATWDLVMPIKASYCDPAGRSVNVQTAESEFDVLRRFRLNPRGKPSSVRDGCLRVMDALADPDLPLVVAERCVGLVRCLTHVKPDKSHPELYDQREDNPYQHALDALRYFFVNHHVAGASGASGVSVATGRSGGGRRSGF